MTMNFMGGNMPETVSKSPFKPHSLEYFRRVEQTGEELVVTDHGRPVVKIVPYLEDPESCLRRLRNRSCATISPLNRSQRPIGRACCDSTRYPCLDLVSQ